MTSAEASRPKPPDRFMRQNGENSCRQLTDGDAYTFVLLPAPLHAMRDVKTFTGRSKVTCPRR